MDLNQVTLPAVDLARSIGFYKTLGLKQIVGNSHYARFVLPKGDATLSLEKVDSIEGAQQITLYFEVADPRAVVEKLQSQGIHLETPVISQPWLWDEARLRDPSGNPLCIFQAGRNRRNPPWRMSDDDM